MDSFLSKASSFLSSEADDQGAPPPSKDGAHRKPTSSGGYGDLLADAQSMMKGMQKPSDEESTDKPPSSKDKYGDLFASAQTFMGSAKPPTKPAKGDDDDGISMDEGKAHKSSGSGGLGSILAGAQGSMKPSGGASIDKDEDDQKKTAKSGYGDVLASAQVLMEAAKVRGEADMGEVAGAASNLVGAASEYGNLEKRGYGEYANKAQAYLHDYQASHGKPSSEGPAHKSPSQNEGFEENYKPSTKAPLKPTREDDDERE
ncbi:hypothetical protein GOP47_0029580 [Adiantum capillus-veneris]|nr:hypothetical protein GOP47_0029580 [Adiantum capillus-veneris]